MGEEKKQDYVLITSFLIGTILLINQWIGSPLFFPGVSELRHFFWFFALPPIILISLKRYVNQNFRVLVWIVFGAILVSSLIWEFNLLKDLWFINGESKSNQFVLDLFSILISYLYSMRGGYLK